MKRVLANPAGRALFCLLSLFFLSCLLPSYAACGQWPCAQESEDGHPTDGDTGFKPNRMLVVNELGQFVPFNLDHVSDIRFVNVDAAASCSITLKECTYERVSISTEISDEVSSYSVGIMTEEESEQLIRDLDIIEWLQRNSIYNITAAEQDLEIAGEGDLIPGKRYRIVAAARDRFGTWDVVSRLDFTALQPDIIGSPEVLLKVEYPSSDSIEVRMMPNKDVSAYYFLFGPEGRYQDYFEKHSEDGYSSFEEMVIQLGTKSEATMVQKWTNLSVRFSYELVIVPLDRRGTVLPAVVSKLVLP